MRFSPLAQRLDRDDTNAWRVHALATRRRAQGDDIIMLTIGDPDFETPPVVVDRPSRACAAAARIRVLAGRRAAARGDRRARVGLGRGPVDWRRVVFFPGAQAALYSVCSCILGEGDEVIVPEPCYATYPGVFAGCGATPVHVPLRPEHNFKLDVGEVEAALTERTRAIVLTTPHNPTGMCTPAETLEALGALCRERDMWLVSDEVYASLTFGGRPHASVLAVAGAEERAVGISSLSKSHAMTGWRSGWAVVPEELARHLVLLLDSMLFGSPPFIMDAALTALREADADTAAHARRLREPRGRRGAARRPCRAALPSARGRDVHHARRARLRLAAGEFAERLLAEEDVSVLPTEGFGPSGHGHVRISLATNEERLAEGCERIARFAASLRARAIAYPPLLDDQLPNPHQSPCPLPPPRLTTLPFPPPSSPPRYDREAGARPGPSTRRGQRSRLRRSRRSPPRCPRAAQ